MVIGLISQRHSLACETIQFSNYEQVATNVYASSNSENIQQVISTISDGRKRVASTFGDMISSPKIILVSDKGEARKFEANSTATAHSSPFGTCIILGPDGQNLDVAAHELTHSEVAHRVGWLRHWVEIPVWFNEGVALIVDHRKPYLVENIELTKREIESVKSLNTSKDFFLKRVFTKITWLHVWP